MEKPSVINKIRENRYKILEKIETPTKDAEITPEMVEWFEIRTRMHIHLVQKYAAKIAQEFPEFKDLVKAVQDHDQSKFEEPERTPYILRTWQLKHPEIQDSEDTARRKQQVLYHHSRGNEHHPEHWAPAVPFGTLVDAREMPDSAIAMMCADWCAMGEEFKDSPVEWAKGKIGTRWQFTPEQEALIYKILSAIWNKPVRESRDLNPTVFYHATENKNLPSIVAHGLSPSVDTTHWGGDLGSLSLGRVFVTADIHSAIFYGRKGIWDSRPHVFRPLLRFHYDPDKLQADDESWADWFSTTTVRPRKFEILVSDIDENPQEWRTLTPEMADAAAGGEWDEIEEDFEIRESRLMEISNVERKRAKQSADKIYRDKYLVVVRPKSREASCLYGKGTKWCTSSTKADNPFSRYLTDDKLTLYYLIPTVKTKRGKYAVAVKPDGQTEAWDSTDRHFSLVSRVLENLWGDIVEVTNDFEYKLDIERVSNLLVPHVDSKDFSDQEITLSESWGGAVEDLDQEYMKAVAENDMEKCRAMVREAAHRAGFLVGPVVHYSDEVFNRFDPEKIGRHGPGLARRIGSLGRGFYFANPDAKAPIWLPLSHYGKYRRLFYLRMDHPYFVHPREGDISDFSGYKPVPDQYDSVRMKNEMYFKDEYMVKTPEQIKSADPVVYDDRREVVPLSKRFNPDSQDIRESVGSSDREITLSDPWGGAVAKQVFEWCDATGSKVVPVSKMDEFRKNAVKSTGLNIRDVRTTWLQKCNEICASLGKRFEWPEEVPMKNRGHFEGKYPDQVFVQQEPETMGTLKESLNSARKRYGQIADKLSSLDPTPTKKYLDFICRSVVDEKEDENIVGEYVKVFDHLVRKNQLDKKDILSYTSFSELKKTVDPLKDKQTKTHQKKGQFKYDGDPSEYDTVYTNRKYTVIRPKTMAASCYFGNGTHWCTAARSKNNKFYTYIDSGRTVYYFIPTSKLMERYAIAASPYDLKGFDEKDSGIDPQKILDKTGVPRSIIVSLPVDGEAWALRAGGTLNHKTGRWDFSRNVNMEYYTGEKFPIPIGTVEGSFHCFWGSLRSLEGGPQRISGDFTCWSNYLQSLKGGPQYVGGNYDCSCNRLTSLEGAPQYVGGYFSCAFNSGIPREEIQRYRESGAVKGEIKENHQHGRQIKLLERSYSEKDIPDKFYRIFYFTHGSVSLDTRIEQLVNHRIPRAGGIADSLEIRKALKHDSMLVMPGPEVVAMNKISRVLYQNPDYFITSRMRNLRRVVNEDDTRAEVRLFSKIIEALGRTAAVFFTLERGLYDFVIQEVPLLKSTGDILKYIRTTNPFAEQTRDWESYRTLQATIQKKPDQALRALKRIILDMVPEDYHLEGEWILKDRVLHIPPKSLLETSESKILDDPDFMKRLQDAGYEVRPLGEVYDG